MSYDQSMSAAQHSGMQLGDFLERPVKIADVQWNQFGLSTDEINPWDAYLSHPTVLRKLANFKLLRGSLHIKIVTNGSPFLYGKMMASYHPLIATDDFAPTNSEDRICRLSQREHVFINPTTSSGGELVVPFFWQSNAVHIPDKEWQKLGEMFLTEISPLKHASGELPMASLAIFAWMDNVSMMQPTSSTTEEFFTAMSSESEKKVVSKAATAAGDAAHLLSNAPVIGPYARATEEVARALGKVADLFGFSKPRGTYDLADVRNRHIGTLAVTNDKDMARPLTLDVHSENTIDPRTVGLGPEDEMSIPHLCAKECLITRFSWKTTDAPDTELFRIPITPYVQSTFPTDDVVDLPPCAYIGSMFEYWRGTLQYRMMINASNFHRGKLRIRYEPYGIGNGQDYNVVQSEIVDLSEVHDHKCEIGWGANKNYLRIADTSVLPTVPNKDAVNLDIHNGVLVVSVANNLTVPDESSEDSIDIVVGMSCCEDIEFAVPTERIYQTMRIVPEVTETPQPPPPGVVIYPQPRNDLPNTLCGVFYYGWFSDNFHNKQGYLRKKLKGSDGSDNIQYPAVPGIAEGEYDDTKQETVSAQFDTMTNMGIDTIIYSWSGPGSRADNQFHTVMKYELGERAFGTLQCAALYETSRLKQNGQLIFNDAAEAQLRRELEDLKISHVSHPYYLKRAFKNNLVSGPVIFIYLLRSYSDQDKALFLQVVWDVFTDSDVGGVSVEPYVIGDIMFGKPRALPLSVTNKLGAISVYDVYGQSKGPQNLNVADVRETHDRFAEWRRLNPSVHCIPTVSPGYNDRGVRLSANNPAMGRALAGYDQGSLFKCHLKEMKERSLKFSNEMFLVNSWNEWHEDTQIEPVKGAPATRSPIELTNGVYYEPYDTKYVNILGEFLKGDDYGPMSTGPNDEPTVDEPEPGFTAQSLEFIGQSNEEERENEHAPETEPEVTILEKPVTYHKDDLIFFGEKVASLRTLIKRYSRMLSVDTFETRKDAMHLPYFPPYLWDNDMPNIQETLLTKISVLYLGRRGSTRWKAIPDFRSEVPHTSVIRLTEKSDLKLIMNLDHSEFWGTGWSGMDVSIGVHNPVLEWEVPYYSHNRFSFSRSLDRSKDRGHMHSYNGASVSANHYLCSGGDDMQFFYFVGTPSVSFV